MTGWQWLGDGLLRRPGLIVGVSAILVCVIVITVFVVLGIVALTEKRRHRGHYDDMAQAEIRTLQGTIKSQRKWVNSIELSMAEMMCVINGVRDAVGRVGYSVPSLEKIEDDMGVER